jgi:DNA-directed RNA polymerase
VRQEVTNGLEYTKLDEQIMELSQKMKTASLEQHEKLLNQRQDLYKQKNQLLARELDAWQLRLPKERKPGSTESEKDELAYHWAWFKRVAHLMPERERLSSLLPMRVPLRSPEGRQAVDDMIAICRQKSPVSDHPALKPVEGRCPVAECPMEVER